MKLTILGNQGPYPSAGGICSGYLLSHNDTHILIDCGTGVLSKLNQYLHPSELSAVFLSHLHFDHMSDMLPMQYALQFKSANTPLPVYLPDTPASVHDLLICPYYSLHSICDCDIGDIHVHVSEVKHPVQTYALRFEADGHVLVFTGDSNECAALDEICSNADLLLADAALNTEKWNEKAPHLSAERCGMLAERCNAVRLVLTHHNPLFKTDELLREAQSYHSDSVFAESGDQFVI